jgi:RNase P protein component
MRGTYHHWTVSEETELAEDIKIQGIDIAVTNFAAKYKLKRAVVRNKALRLNKGIFSSRHGSEPLVLNLNAEEWKPKPKQKADKIIIMVAKEYMNKLKVEFSEGKLTIMYPKEDQLDIKFL